MKNKAKKEIKASELVVVLIVLTSLYFINNQFFHKKIKTDKIEIVSIVKKEQPLNQAPPLETNETQANSETLSEENIKTTLGNESADPIAKNEIDPVIIKIKAHSQFINKKHEQRLREILKSGGQEKLMDTYLALKEERILKIYNQLKTDSSRKASVKINYEFHDKLFLSFGKDLYILYLKELKQTNDEAKSTKIVLEF